MNQKFTVSDIEKDMIAQLLKENTIKKAEEKNIENKAKYTDKTQEKNKVGSNTNQINVNLKSENDSKFSTTISSTGVDSIIQNINKHETEKLKQNSSTNHVIVNTNINLNKNNTSSKQVENIVNTFEKPQEKSKETFINPNNVIYASSTNEKISNTTTTSSKGVGNLISSLNKAELKKSVDAPIINTSVTNNTSKINSNNNLINQKPISNSIITNTISNQIKDNKENSTKKEFEVVLDFSKDEKQTSWPEKTKVNSSQKVTEVEPIKTSIPNLSTSSNSNLGKVEVSKNIETAKESLEEKTITSSKNHFVENALKNLNAHKPTENVNTNQPQINVHSVKDKTSIFNNSSNDLNKVNNVPQINTVTTGNTGNISDKINMMNSEKKHSVFVQPSTNIVSDIPSILYFINYII